MKLFKRKQQIEGQDNYEYWKDPRLGTDDDEGCYDYYACDKPDNKQYMCWSNCKCDDCRKEPRFNRYGKAWNVYWYAWDGWDGDSGFVCWRCLLKSQIYSLKRKFRDKIKQRKEYKEWIKMFKSKGVPITKELKERTEKIVRKEW